MSTLCCRLWFLRSIGGHGPYAQLVAVAPILHLRPRLLRFWPPRSILNSLGRCDYTTTLLAAASLQLFGCDEYVTALSATASSS